MKVPGNVRKEYALKACKSQHFAKKVPKKRVNREILPKSAWEAASQDPTYNADLL